MKKMILLFSHKLTDEQKQDAQSNWAIKEFLSLPIELQSLWSNVPAKLEDIKNYLEPIRIFCSNNISKDDIVLVQGDFGATYKMVGFVNSLQASAVYATTKRDVVEKEIDGKIVKTSIFKHIRFREF
jgi:hypothetical protein